MTRGNGIITVKDLRNYHAIERPPLTVKYHSKYDVYVPPPPCSGGVCLLEELNILERFRYRQLGPLVAQNHARHGRNDAPR